jgi:hypothetical protein
VIGHARHCPSAKSLFQAASAEQQPSYAAQRSRIDGIGAIGYPVRSRVIRKFAQVNILGRLFSALVEIDMLSRLNSRYTRKIRLSDNPIFK